MMYDISTALPYLARGLIVNGIGFSVLVRSGKAAKMLTWAGVVHSFILGTLLWGALGRPGWSVGVLFLFVGSAVTRVRHDYKTRRGIAEGRGGVRGPENVWGSAATAAICALTSTMVPGWSAMCKVGFVASFATKLSDTVATEIGKAYGLHTWHLSTLSRVPPGTVGAVSIEGTSSGIGASIVLTLFGCYLGLINYTAIPACIGAAFIATTFESLLGEVAQKGGGPPPKWLTSELLNFVMTQAGACIAMCIWNRTWFHEIL